MNLTTSILRDPCASNQRVWCPAILVTTLFALLSVAHGADYRLKTAAFVGGGGTATNATFRLAATLHPSVVGTAAGGSYAVTGRFSGVHLVQTPGAPRLSIANLEAGFVLHWPVIATGFRLQSSDSLTEPRWVDVPLPVVLAGDQYSVRVSVKVGNPASFYRLFKP